MVVNPTIITTQADTATPSEIPTTITTPDITITPIEVQPTTTTPDTTTIPLETQPTNPTEDPRTTTRMVEVASPVSDIVLNFSVDIGGSTTVISQITTTSPTPSQEDTTTNLPNTRDPQASPRAVQNSESSNTIRVSEDKVEDITESFQITFETPILDASTTPLSLISTTTPLSLHGNTTPVSLSTDTTALFLEQDPSCTSGLVCGGRCLARSQVCDSLQDCEDGQDEADCGFPSCQQEEFSCLKGRCLPGEWKCDGKPDCSQGEDEVACAASCPPDQFLCGEGRCIPAVRTCDGVPDCGRGEDEVSRTKQHCDSGLQVNCTCGADQVQCKFGGGCVAQEARCNGRKECGDGSDELGCRAVTPPGEGRPSWSPVVPSSLPGCGDWTLSEDLAAQLAGGEEVEVQWPTLALLFNVKTTSSCTASIISTTWLATSYSCLDSFDPTEWVLFGGPSDDSSQQIRIVASLSPHPWAQRAQHLTRYDLALVRLQEPLVFSDTVSAVCLAEQEVQQQQLCVSAGWVSAGAGVSFSQYLTYLPEPVVQPATCNSTQLYNGHLTEGMLCSKANGDSAVCHVRSPSLPPYPAPQEDQGAPLMCLSGASWHLQGVLSSRGGCRGQGRRPAVFTDISVVRDWVLHTMGS